VEKLQSSISQLHTQFEATLTVAEAKNSHLIEQLQQQATATFSMPVQSSPNTPQSTNLGEGVVRFADMLTPQPLGITEVFIDGLSAPTPITRPVSAMFSCSLISAYK